jgi:6-phosphogluconolactonase (cycloisomerase 2 family)
MKFDMFVMGLLGAALAAQGSVHALEDAGAVYSMTNSPINNEVLIYTRDASGALHTAGAVATGGTGLGTGLNSQGALTMSDDQRWLFVVNAGSNSLSVFRVGAHGGLTPMQVIASGGSTPTSVAYRNGLVYVLNAGLPNNVSGFRVDSRGRLTPLPNSTRSLSAPATAPAQVGFSDDGSTLIVTERATNTISTFAIDGEGLLDGPFATPSAGPTPFGFAVDKRNTLFVSEAGAGGGASTYTIADTPHITAASSMLMTGQRAACWAIVTNNGRFGYVSNAGTGNISGFRIHQDGTAALLNDDGVTAVTGGNPTDMAMSNNSQYLFVRVAARGTLAIFRVLSDGSLAPVKSTTALPASAVGLAGY